MTETPAQAYARAHAVWSQWLRHWHRTGKPRALRTAIVCGQIAEEKLAAWRSDLPLNRTAYGAARAADWPMDDLMQIACFERTVQIARAEWLATPDEPILADKRHAARGAAFRADPVAPPLNLRTMPHRHYAKPGGV